jgi:hypothetical protein
MSIPSATLLNGLGIFLASLLLPIAKEPPALAESPVAIAKGDL